MAGTIIKKNIIITILKAILAGICIGIGAVVFLSCENKIIGSALFGIGLFTIVHFDLYLYTGKIGYIVTDKNKFNYLISLLLIWTGNFIGTFLVGLAIHFSRLSEYLTARATALCEIKMSDNQISIIVLSIFCGLLMFIAVDGKKRIDNSFASTLVIFLGVMVFIICGFEHCIANMAYFSIANMWSLKSLGYIGLMTLGNSIGGILMPLSELPESKV